ncbi:MAG: hypothetical protein HZA16_10060 [Nitrospirae bacterium]|nr:hypothetical protein [Nitrospirota bacterium]
MNDNFPELENVRKKCETLDNELNSFFESIKEIRSVRDSVAGLPDRLKQNEAELEQQKMEMDNMLSSTRNLLISFEEQAKGLFFDLEKKTDALAGNVTTSISELGNVFETGSGRLIEEQKERLGQIIKAYDQIQMTFEGMKHTITLHDQSIAALQNNYAEALKILEKSDLSFRDIRKSLSDLQKRPSEMENRIKGMESRLREQFFSRLERQKYVILAMLAVMIAAVVLFLLYPGQ